MVGCPVSGRVVLLVNEHSWRPFSIAQVFLNTDRVFSSSLITFIFIFCHTSKTFGGPINYSLLVRLSRKLNYEVLPLLYQNTY